jgi:hypothetical protein
MVPGPVGDPGLRLAVRQGYRDERGPQVVHAKRVPYGRPFKNLGPRDARRLEIGPQMLGHLVDIQGPPRLAENVLVLSGASYRARAKRDGIENGQSGAITFVQRFGSLNLNVHFHVAVLDGVFSRDPDAGVRFHPAAPPTGDELEAILRRVQDRSVRWLRRRGHLDERPMEERSNEPPVQTALDACATLAMGRGQVAVLPNAEAPEDDPPQTPDTPDTPAVAVERDGFNLHAGVRIEAGDDIGRERLCRYGARPPLSLERLRRLPGGRVAYRLKYVSRGRGKHRVMTAMDFMARLAALIAPPRYPLSVTRVSSDRAAHGDATIVPRPRERTEHRAACDASGEPARDAVKGRAEHGACAVAAARRAGSSEGDPAGPRGGRGCDEADCASGRRRKTFGERALRAPLGSLDGRRALRRHAKGGLGVSSAPQAHLGPPFRIGADERPTLGVMSKPPRVPILRQR